MDIFRAQEQSTLEHDNFGEEMHAFSFDTKTDGTEEEKNVNAERLHEDGN